MKQHIRQKYGSWYLNDLHVGYSSVEAAPFQEGLFI